MDVTMALVRLFEPSEKTLRLIAQLEGKEPLDLDEVMRLDEEE